MEKDKNIEALIKESGIISAPKKFTAQVMDRIKSEPERITYKPLIGRFGKLFILIMVMSSITISIIFSEPSSFLAERSIQLPQWNLSFPNIPELNLSTGLLAALLAVFILVATDSILRKRNHVW